MSAIRLSRMKPARPAVRPRVVAVAGAVQQIQDRIPARRTGLVAGRRVDVHAAKDAERRRFVGHLGDASARDVLGVEHRRTGHVHQAPGVGVRLAGRGVAWVQRRHPVDDERIPIGPGRHRAHRRFPYASIGPGHRRAALERHAGKVARVQAHRLGLRRVDAQRDGARGRDLRRHEDRRRAACVLGQGAGRRDQGARCRHEEREQPRCVPETHHPLPPREILPSSSQCRSRIPASH